MSDWQRHSENLIRSLAPEDFGSSPVYIVGKSEAGELYRDFHAYAFTTHGLDLLLKPVLIQSKRWRGRGGAVVVHDELLQKRDGRDFGPALQGVLLHEASHLISDIGVVSDPVIPESLPEIREGIAAAVSTPTDKRIPPTYWHNLKWLRCLLHLYWRALFCGHEVTLESLGIPFIPRNYPEMACILAGHVEQEATEKQHIPLSEILANPGPIELDALWIGYILPFCEGASHGYRYEEERKCHPG